MNEQKIAFIICVNDEDYFSECKKYIESLNVPAGMTVEIVPVRGAVSMCSGYNTGMRATDAKYKVYMHQDVFILNRNFIADVIRTFSFDEKVGMIGVVGGSNLPEDAMCFMEWDTGNLIECRAFRTIVYPPQQKGEPAYVWALDGLLIVTNRDIPWREDVFNGWDFYDISQGMEFMRSGLRAVVPYQETPWCFHDNGILNLSLYDKNRKIFCETYSEYFKYGADMPVEQSGIGFEDEIRKGISEIREHFDKGHYQEAIQAAAGYHGLKNKDNELFSLYAIAGIILEEMNAGKKCLIGKNRNTEQLLREYQKLRFMIFRIEADLNTEKEPREMLENEETSEEALKLLIDLIAYNKEKVVRRIFG